MDHQTYFKSLRIEQAHLGRVVMDRIFAAWLEEASLLGAYAVLRTLQSPIFQWIFDGTEHVDPAKEARAQAARLASNTTTLAYEYARQGKDWEAELRQRAKERKLMGELGLESEETVSDESARPDATETKNTQEKQKNASNTQAA